MVDSLQVPATAASEGISTDLQPQAATAIKKSATGVFICVHGHFYQPPRENPYLDAIERQPGAEPFHDWNERIHYECYRPNAYARILNDRGEVIRIVNTFEYLSFNIGPTLMSWMERHDPETYRRILEADRLSAERLGGHGNAIAQVYNHIILPLANLRDKRTQVRWGIADFKRRFGRDPEGIWLAETAIDYPTLEVLVDEGIKFTILAPSQVQRCRDMTDDGEWHEVGGGQIDPNRPYRCFLRHPDGSPDRDRYLDVFFYDGPISRDMGFNDVLSSSQHFAGRVGQAIHGDHRPYQLVSVATDGETFGHHKGGAEKTLAYAITEEFARWGWQVTNYAHYLATHPPTWEAELKPVTAWSCSHGVERWRDDCGCGGGGGWQQQWRRPLRDTLDWLRDRLIPVYEAEGAKFFKDPWQARDAYVDVIGSRYSPVPGSDRSAKATRAFFNAHQCRPLTKAERVEALQLLEMQRHTLLMYTSCGWFFDEISRPEGTQILRYAARALELAGEASGMELESEFIQRLEAAPSNVDSFKTGAEIYRQLVIPSRVSLEQVAAHYAMSSLFSDYGPDEQLYCYRVFQQDYQLQRMGPMTLAVGQLELTSTITHESLKLAFAVLHLGGWDFHCCIQQFRSRLAYSRAKDELFAVLEQASAAQTILALNRTFGDRTYSLQNLFAEERHRIMQLLSQETLLRLDQLYSQVYRDNYGILRAFHRDGLTVPQELQVAADVTLSQRAMEVIQSLDGATSAPSESPLQQGIYALDELEAIATEASYFHCRLTLPSAKPLLEGLIWRSVSQLITPDHTVSSEDIDWLERLIALDAKLGLGLSLARTQELYYQHLQTVTIPTLLTLPQHKQDLSPWRLMLRLGRLLAIDIGHWEYHLQELVGE
ncbi:glycoside hydrolase [filamentous cyanobacterium CCP5]|nr:glycoside hydrolase [filamentous cyanobacterium CCP5]